MKSSRIIDLKFLKGFTEFATNNKSLIIVTVFFLTGLIFGAFTFGKYQIAVKYVTDYFEDFLTDNSNVQFFKVFFGSVLSSLFWIVLLFVFGTCILGIVPISFTVAFKGYLYSTLISFLFNTYSLKGVAFCAVIILPSALFFLIAFLSAGNESLKFSFSLAQNTFTNSAQCYLTHLFKSYCYKYLGVVLVTLFAAVVDSLICTNFLSDFKL